MRGRGTESGDFYPNVSFARTLSLRPLPPSGTPHPENSDRCREIRRKRISDRVKTQAPSPRTVRPQPFRNRGDLIAAGTARQHRGASDGSAGDKPACDDRRRLGWGGPWQSRAGHHDATGRRKRDRQAWYVVGYGTSVASWGNGRRIRGVVAYLLVIFRGPGVATLRLPRDQRLSPASPAQHHGGRRPLTSWSWLTVQPRSCRWMGRTRYNCSGR